MGTGRSDYPNQINNVSGFPYIFRGALDVEATEINEAMKIAAAEALAALVKNRSRRKSVPPTMWTASNTASTTLSRSRLIRAFDVHHARPSPRRRWIRGLPASVLKISTDTP